MLNALEAMPNGGDLTLATESGGDDVVISVADSGAGIPAEQIAHVFEPFFTRRSSGSGTGLGLYIARSIVELHQGRIDLTSQQGKGTVFKVVLPRI